MQRNNEIGGLSFISRSEKPLRVLLVEPFGDYKGHTSGYPKYLSRALSDSGADVTMLSFKGLVGLTEHDTKVRRISVLSEGGTLGNLARCLSKLFSSIRPLRMFINPLQTFSVFLLALRKSGKQGNNIIHILDSSMSYLSFLILACFTKNRRLVYTISNPPLRQLLRKPRNTWSCLNIEYMMANLEKSRFMDGAIKLLYWRAIARNHLAFVCHSRWVQEAFADSVFYDKIICIPWGIELPREQAVKRPEAREHLGLPLKGTLFLSFGINHPRKNLEVIFQAVQNLPKNFKILFAGEIMPQSAQQNDPKRFAKDYSWLDDTIIVDKYIPDEEIPYYFCAADAIILSYRREFIGASGVLSHAAGFCLPVIADDMGDIGELVKENSLGLTFTSEDPHSLQKAILSFLDLREEEKKEIKKNLARFASAYSWEYVAKEHLKVYQTLPKKVI